MVGFIGGAIAMIQVILFGWAHDFDSSRSAGRALHWWGAETTIFALLFGFVIVLGAALPLGIATGWARRLRARVARGTGAGLPRRSPRGLQRTTLR